MAFKKQLFDKKNQERKRIAWEAEEHSGDQALSQHTDASASFVSPDCQKQTSQGLQTHFMVQKFLVLTVVNFNPFSVFKSLKISY